MGVHNHLPHLEDLLILEGRAGLKKINRVLSLLKIQDYSNFSLKYDGSPSVFIGTDPRDNQFFVAKKSIFNKKPIIYKNLLDIYEHIKNPELRVKMCHVFNHFRYVEVPGTIQGDILFTNRVEEVTGVNFDTENHANVRPNVIGYNFHPKSEYFEKINQALIGFVPHTAYSISAGFGLERCPMPSIEYPDHIFHLSTQVCVFPYNEKNGIRFKYEENVRQLDQKYFNNFIRAGEEFPCEDEFETLYAMIAYKKERILNNIMNNLVTAIDIRPAFLTKENKVLETAHEGLVYSDSDFSVKIVNRRHFSHANFSDLFLKGWNKNDLYK